jgi:hypothetical protein
MNKKPVYPKENPEHKKRVMDEFYKKVKNTDWNDEYETSGKPRGRKSKKLFRPEAKLRSSEKYNWFK